MPEKYKDECIKKKKERRGRRKEKCQILRLLKKILNIASVQ